MPLDLVAELSQLVRIPSVNPMGRPVTGDIYFEHKVTDHLEAFFKRHGMPCVRQKVAPLRENIIARVDGDVPPERGGPMILLEAHQDTVPIDGMTIEPFGGVVLDGRVWGRGANDIKGGMAAMLGACVRLAEEKPKGRPTVIMACSVNEEHGFSGAATIAQCWTKPESTPGAHLIPKRPDAVIIAEPTLLDIVVAHKGVCRWRVHANGRAGHSSRPEIADNAIYRMAKVLNELEVYAKTEVHKRASHRMLTGPTLSVGIIGGGVSVNTVPDRCTIEIDRRVLPVPEDNPAAAQRHVIEWLESRLGQDFPVAHEEPFLLSPGLSDRTNHALAERLGAVVRATGLGEGKAIGVPFGTDAPPYDASGAPTVVFGPGSIDQAHTCDEWLAIDQLEAASEVLYRFAREYGV